MVVEFSPETYKKFEEVLTRYPTKRAAILPTFWLAQNEFGCLSSEAMEYIGGLLELSPAYVASVASFYTMFNKEPLGKFHLQVCANIACTLRGAEHIIECIEKKLGIGLGQTTADGNFTLSEVECLGSCGTAPVVQINDDYHENLTTTEMLRLLDELPPKQEQE